MTQTVYYTAMSLDGFLADEHDSLDWLFTPEIDADGAMGYGAFISTVGSIVMGATTYLWVLDHLRASGESWSYTQPCWVMTHRDLPRIADNVRFAAADTPDDVRRCHADLVAAAAGKDVWLVGGGGLAEDLAGLGLLERLMVSIAPVTLGSGKGLLSGRVDLQLTGLERNGAFACLWYDVQRPRSD